MRIYIIHIKNKIFSFLFLIYNYLIKCKINKINFKKFQKIKKKFQNIIKKILKF